MLRHVDLCSGIGGFALGFQWADLSVPVLFCDKDQFCQRVLAKHWPDVPIAGDVEELSLAPTRFVPDCDIITAGYPCQPFSIAGKRKGEADDRHIWPFILKIVAQKRPTFCVFENVYGHLNMGLDKVLFDLEAQNYSSRTFVVPACGVDAPHKRDRLWIIAHTNSQGEPDVTRPDRKGKRLGEHDILENTRHRRGRDQRPTETGQDTSREWSADPSEVSGSSEQPTSLAYSDSKRGRLWDAERQNAETTWEPPSDQRHNASRVGSWLPEPRICRVAHGIPNRVHRLRALGNAIVPQIAQQIGETIKAIHYGDH